jgi:hypothetical protein
MQRVVIRTVVRIVAPLATGLALAACATPQPGPPVTVLPGKGRDLAAFQQDDAICQRHAVAFTGYGDLTQPATPKAPVGTPPASTAYGTAPATPAGSGTATASASVPLATQPENETSYLQCMAARGDTVQPLAAAYPTYGYAYGYPDDYGYPYPFYDDGFYGGFGWGGWPWHGRFGGHEEWHGGFAHNGFGHPGFGHAGFGHGGFGHGGFGHGGFGHGGFGHGGFGHGGGGGHR